MQIFKGELLIEFDPIEEYCNNKKSEEVNFYGTKLNIINKETLVKQYKKASEVSQDKPEEHKRKYKILLK